jgi:hypothetical protein
MIKITHRMRGAMLVATIAVAGCAMTPMASNTVNFVATLSGTAEVPPNGSTGTGTLEASLTKDTSVLRWKISYSGLTGPASAAHFHGPAMAGANAGVVLPFNSAASPIEGQATLTAAQVADLMAGKWYANVHTAENKGGEIRGQVMAK